MNPKNPTSREKQEHEDSGHAVCRSWCAACVEGRGVGGQHRIELLVEEERERTTPIVAFGCGFVTHENADTIPVDMVKLGGRVVSGKVPQRISFYFLLVLSEVFFRRIMLKCDNEPSTQSLQDALIESCADSTGRT